MRALWAENRTDTTRVILFCDLECPLRSRAMAWINHHVSTFMGAITASPNKADEPTGAIKRLFAALRHRREKAVVSNNATARCSRPSNSAVR